MRHIQSICLLCFFLMFLILERTHGLTLDLCLGILFKLFLSFELLKMIILKFNIKNK